MSISKCIVRLKDSQDTQHEVAVYAESFYEAVLQKEETAMRDRVIKQQASDGKKKPVPPRA